MGQVPEARRSVDKDMSAILRDLYLHSALGIKAANSHGKASKFERALDAFQQVV